MSRQTTLLTGASGVVGSAVLERLGGDRVICLTHRTVPEAARHSVRGDVTRPRLGLNRDEYRRLVSEVDVVVHCAAVTDFAAGRGATMDVNVAGTARVLDLAGDAEAVLHYVSTAFVHRTDFPCAAAPDAVARPDDYLASKGAAEDLVRAADLPGTIVRPSIVSGDASTGRITKFQGLHNLALAVLRSNLPFLPLRDAARIDWVPQDHLADALAGLIEHDVRAGEYWVTAGEHALSVHRLLEIATEVAAANAVVVDQPRFIDPETVDRLVRPVFIEGLPDILRRRFDEMTALAALVATESDFPSTTSGMPGRAALDPASIDAAWRASVRYILRVKNLVPATAGRP